MLAATAGEKAVRATCVTRDEHGGERLVGVGLQGDVRTAPWEELEERVVVTTIGQVYGLALLDRGGLAGQLRGVLAFVDDHAASKSSPNVVAASMPERFEEHFRRQQRKDPCVLRLNRSRRRELSFGETVGQICLRFRLDDDARDLRASSPFDQLVDSLRRGGRRTTRNICLARETH